MMPFIGRTQELAILRTELGEVRAHGGGRFVWVMGRRRVGKSRLVDAFVTGAQVPFIFFQAPRRSRVDALERFRTALESSTAPVAAQIRAGATFTNWPAALTLAASGATREHPVVIVLDRK